MDIVSHVNENYPIIFDGAMGTQLQLYSLTEKDFDYKEGCNEILNITRPDIVTEIHCNYLDAGAQVIETNSFGANRIKLKEYGLEEKTQEINVAAARAARNALEQRERDREALVCGTVGPTGFLPSSGDSSLNDVSFDTLVNVFTQQALALQQGGADMFLIETSQDLLEVKAAVIGIRHAAHSAGKELPLQVQITLDSTGHMLLGSDIGAFLGAVGNLEPDIIGLNCSTGPGEMMPHVESLLDKCAIPVSMIPNAGMPENVDGKASYTMQPEEFAALLAPAVIEKGVSVVGGCCGTTPEHISQLAYALKGKRIKTRQRAAKSVFSGTGISGIDLETTPKPFIIGERCNAQGSRNTKNLLLAYNWNELGRIAQQQVNAGATLLDVSVALNERDDERESMVTFVRYLSERVSMPFCIDSTDPAVIESALKSFPGAGLINSINLEHDTRNAHEILSVASRFRCPVIGLTIDDTGMAKTIERKIECTRRLYELVHDEFGMPGRFLYIDPLIFTLATGDRDSADAARISLDAIRDIKRQFPDIRTVMGVSNISYGLMPAARRVLNNMMLYHAGNYGLDAAIFNPHHIDDVDAYDDEMKEVTDALIFNTKNDALDRFIEYFQKRGDAVQSSEQSAADKGESMDCSARLYNKVINRDNSDIEALVKECCESRKPLNVLNEILMPAMQDVGERMERGEMILPFVLQAAEVMRAAIDIIEPMLQQQEQQSRGTIILATVYGDVHDIGKNLVASIIKNQGYTVIDLGKQVPVETIMEAVTKHEPDAIGLSALLITTSKEMTECVHELDKKGVDVPVLIGGAAVNKSFAERISKINDSREYAGGVYYAKDAFQGLQILEKAKKNRT